VGFYLISFISFERSFDKRSEKKPVMQPEMSKKKPFEAVVESVQSKSSFCPGTSTTSSAELALLDKSPG